MLRHGQLLKLWQTHRVAKATPVSCRSPMPQRQSVSDHLQTRPSRLLWATKGDICRNTCSSFTTPVQRHTPVDCRDGAWTELSRLYVRDVLACELDARGDGTGVTLQIGCNNPTRGKSKGSRGLACKVTCIGLNRWSNIESSVDAGSRVQMPNSSNERCAVN